MFQEYGKKLDRNAVLDLYDLLQGYTYYLQRTMNEAFALLPTNAICDRDFLFERIDEILTSNTDAYKDLLSALTTNQRALLSSVAQEGRATNLTSSDFISRYGLVSASSVQSAARALLKRQLLTRTPDKHYYMDDKFLELWLARPNGITLERKLEQMKS